jgi:DNA-binding MarR family transcriptional regulator
MSRLRTANLLGALAGEVTNCLDRQFKEHPNQTNSSAAALNVIAYFEGCTNTQLANALRLSHPAAVRLVDKLEAEGLVEARDAKDRRAVALVLTEKGKARTKTVLEQRCVTLSAVIEVLSDGEQSQLARCLEKMLTHMTRSVDQAVYICRLCDEIACPADHCPVHQKALGFEGKEGSDA